MASRIQLPLLSLAYVRGSIVLMDELDQLVTTKQDVVYNFFNWPTIADSKLIVIAVANTHDLPERVMTGRVRSRLGTPLNCPAVALLSQTRVYRNGSDKLHAVLGSSADGDRLIAAGKRETRRRLRSYQSRRNQTCSSTSRQSHWRRPTNPGCMQV